AVLQLWLIGRSLGQHTCEVVTLGTAPAAGGACPYRDMYWADGVHLSDKGNEQWVLEIRKPI
ncbi:hypothetical protein JRQ81_007436, partial [Phrynocephalus forsythii]